MIPIAEVQQCEHIWAMLPSTTSLLSPIPAGWQVLHHAILSDGTLALVTTDVDFASEWERILASDTPVDPPSRIEQLYKIGRARLLTRAADGWQDGPVFPLETAHPLIDRFSDGRWLVVASRTRSEPNARVLAPDGALQSRFMLGDAIEHVVIDSLDRIWVGWFDEGMDRAGYGVAAFLQWGCLLRTRRRCDRDAVMARRSWFDRRLLRAHCGWLGCMDIALYRLPHRPLRSRPTGAVVAKRAYWAEGNRR
ncbi:hypothetical protein [Sphingomonas glacialis]|uniref:hypothetical protein n=1 Tax=Sphingomonas glacialis TaxID=658225 RepID=UPI001676E231|nr:hypothetical protein [Sphingomonas glacialis]